jgi:serine protease Do
MNFDELNRKNRSLFGYFLAALTGAVLGGLLLLMFGPGTLFSRFPQSQPETKTMGLLAEDIKVVTTPQSISDIGLAAGKVMPAVVGIIRPIEPENNKGGVKSAEIGTGVIVDPSGYILTNNHVADMSKDLTISLYDGSNVIGRVVWSDAVLDISIVKVDQANLAIALLGDSKKVKIGDTAVAIGNPLGLKFQRSVTSGIISALNRTVQMSQNVFMEDLIQTDASINPGNSGGPLINLNGEVIGINTVKVSTAEGMGFAIPINMAKPIIKSIKETGKFVEPVLGVRALDMAMAAYYDYKVSRGVYIYNCTPGSPGFNAGIRSGDSIISINGTTINTLLDLKENLYNIGINGTANIYLYTPAGKYKYASVKLVPFK